MTHGEELYSLRVRILPGDPCASEKSYLLMFDQKQNIMHVPFRVIMWMWRAYDCCPKSRAYISIMQTYSHQIINHYVNE
jgi:hypothetical protein